MDCLTPVGAASFETTVFLDHFKDMPDCRQPGKVARAVQRSLLNCHFEDGFEAPEGGGVSVLGDRV